MCAEAFLAGVCLGAALLFVVLLVIPSDWVDP